MSKKIASAVMAAVVVLTATAPAAFAGPRHNGERHHYRDAGRHDHHRGRGHYKNGKWIALGILGAAAAAAAAESDRDCYYRRGVRYCD